MPFRQFQPGRALRAVHALVADPDDLAQVFTVLESLAGDTLERLHRRMRKSDTGLRLLASRPDVVGHLSDRGALARLPEGSLGRAYLAFVEAENISAEGIRAADVEGAGAPALPAPLGWVRDRMRDTHDLWHVVIGYSGDVLGEMALLAFIFAQTWNPAVALLLAFGWKELGALPDGAGQAARRTMLDGFQRGQRAAWLPAEDWEAMLAEPLSEVRRRLALDEPPVYARVRSADFHAARARKRRWSLRARTTPRALHAPHGPHAPRAPSVRPRAFLAP